MNRNASSGHCHSSSPQPGFAHATFGAPSAPGRGPHTGTPRYDAPSRCAPAPVHPSDAATAFHVPALQSPLHQLGGPVSAACTEAAVAGDGVANELAAA